MSLAMHRQADDPQLLTGRPSNRPRRKHNRISSEFIFLDCFRSNFSKTILSAIGEATVLQNINPAALVDAT